MWNRTVLAAVAASILATTSVFAQTPPDANAPAAPPARGDNPTPGRAQERAQQAHDRLGITAAQQPQWDSLMSVMRETGQAMRSNPSAHALRTRQMDGVQELRAAADVARQRADALQRIIPAVEALYAVLSPEQRQIADRDITRIVQHDGHHRG